MKKFIIGLSYSLHFNYIITKQMSFMTLVLPCTNITVLIGRFLQACSATKQGNFWRSAQWNFIAIFYIDKIFSLMNHCRKYFWGHNPFSHEYPSRLCCLKVIAECVVMFLNYVGTYWYRRTVFKNTFCRHTYSISSSAYLVLYLFKGFCFFFLFCFVVGFFKSIRPLSSSLDA